MMALSPSAYALSNVVDLYRFTGAQDPDAGVAPGGYGSPFASGVACSIQPDDPIRFLDGDTGRMVEKIPYDVFFASDPGLKTDDKIAGTGDSAGVVLFVSGTANQAGKGGTFVVTAEQRR